MCCRRPWSRCERYHDQSFSGTGRRTCETIRSSRLSGSADLVIQRWPSRSTTLWSGSLRAGASEKWLRGPGPPYSPTSQCAAIAFLPARGTARIRHNCKAATSLEALGSLSVNDNVPFVTITAWSAWPNLTPRNRVCCHASTPPCTNPYSPLPR